MRGRCPGNPAISAISARASDLSKEAILEDMLVSQKTGHREELRYSTDSQNEAQINNPVKQFQPPVANQAIPGEAPDIRKKRSIPHCILLKFLTHKSRT